MPSCAHGRAGLHAWPGLSPAFHHIPRAPPFAQAHPVPCVPPLSPLAAGLNYLHSKNVVHMDLKSSNILLTSHGVAKLADVGFARVQVGQPGCFRLPAWRRTRPALLGGQLGSHAHTLVRRCPALPGIQSKTYLSDMTGLVGTFAWWVSAGWGGVGD